MAFNMPTIPQYRDRSPAAIVDPNRNTPMARRSDFYAANPWEDPGYDQFGNKVGAACMGFLNRASAMDPTKAGGWLSDPSSYMAKFGINAYDPLNPHSQAQMGAGMANLRGGQQNLLQEGVGQMANAGVAAGRGGFGVTGGTNPEASAQQAMMKSLADKYGSNYMDIAGLLNNSAGIASSNAGNYANAYSKILGDYLGAGQGLTGQQLQAISGKNASQTDWRNQAGAAYGQDVQDYNQQVAGAPQRAWQERQQQQQMNDAQFGRDQKAGALDQLKNAVSGYKSGLSYPYFEGMAPIWQQQAGITPGSYASQGAGVLRRSQRPGLNPDTEAWLGRNAYTA
jgi:hypothetical protein